jgi:ABC-type antimicrobial peptide transport system permease subunit
MRLTSPTLPIDLPIAAIVPDFISDRGSVLLSRDILQRYWRDHLVNYFAVFLETPMDSAKLRDEIARSADPGDSALMVLSMAAMREEIDSAIAAAFADIDALQLLVALITVAGIVDLVVSNVLDRRRLHAIVRVVGTTHSTVLAIISCEGAVIGVTAGCVGVLVGIVASWIWIRFTYPVLVGYVLHLHIAWVNAIVCVTLASVMAVLAGVAAGYLRLREEPVDALRAE